MDYNTSITFEPGDEVNLPNFYKLFKLVENKYNGVILDYDRNKTKINNIEINHPILSGTIGQDLDLSNKPQEKWIIENMYNNMILSTKAGEVRKKLENAISFFNDLREVIKQTMISKEGEGLFNLIGTTAIDVSTSKAPRNSLPQYFPNYTLGKENLDILLNTFDNTRATNSLLELELVKSYLNADTTNPSALANLGSAYLTNNQDFLNLSKRQQITEFLMYEKIKNYHSDKSIKGGGTLLQFFNDAKSKIDNAFNLAKQYLIDLTQLTSPLTQSPLKKKKISVDRNVISFIKTFKQTYGNVKIISKSTKAISDISNIKNFDNEDIFILYSKVAQIYKGFNNLFNEQPIFNVEYFVKQKQDETKRHALVDIVDGSATKAKTFVVNKDLIHELEVNLFVIVNDGTSYSPPVFVGKGIKYKNSPDKSIFKLGVNKALFEAGFETTLATPANIEKYGFSIVLRRQSRDPNNKSHIYKINLVPKNIVVDTKINYMITLSLPYSKTLQIENLFWAKESEIVDSVKNTNDSIINLTWLGNTISKTSELISFSNDTLKSIDKFELPGTTHSANSIITIPANKYLVSTLPINEGNGAYIDGRFMAFIGDEKVLSALHKYNNIFELREWLVEEGYSVSPYWDRIQRIKNIGNTDYFNSEIKTIDNSKNNYMKIFVVGHYQGESVDKLENELIVISSDLATMLSTNSPELTPIEANILPSMLDDALPDDVVYRDGDTIKFNFPNKFIKEISIAKNSPLLNKQIKYLIDNVEWKDITKDKKSFNLDEDKVKLEVYSEIKSNLTTQKVGLPLKEKGAKLAIKEQELTKKLADLETIKDNLESLFKLSEELNNAK